MDELGQIIGIWGIIGMILFFNKEWSIFLKTKIKRKWIIAIIHGPIVWYFHLFYFITKKLNFYKEDD